MMVSVKVNLLTLTPVSAFQIVMELGLIITARRSRHPSWEDIAPLEVRSPSIVGVPPGTNESPAMVDLYRLEIKSF